MPGPSLHVTGQTSIKDLQQFAAEAGDGAKIRGKEHKDGSITLYASTKKGTGLKNWLFGTTAKRRGFAQSAITQILFANTKRIDTTPGGKSELDSKLTDVLGFLPPRSSELHGKGLKDISSFAVDAWNESFKPSGMQVGQHGAVTGTMRLTTAVDEKNLQVKPLQTLFTDTAKSYLAKTSNVGGVEISSKANDDLVRMDCSIGGYKTFGPPGGDGTPQMNKKREDNARAILNFAGSPNAAKVLSSVMNQYMLRPLETALETGSGDKLKRILANRGNENDFTYKDSNGVSHNVGKPGQYNAAKYTIDTYNDGTGDFKVTVSWDLYAVGFQNADSTGKVNLPTPHPDRVVKTSTNVEWRISKSEADKGNLVLTMPTPPTTTFDGHLY